MKWPLGPFEPVPQTRSGRRSICWRAAVERRARLEAKPGATPTEEFALMQDDRARLAVELDERARTRGRALEAANAEAAKKSWRRRARRLDKLARARAIEIGVD